MKQVLRTSLVLDGVFSLCRYVVEGGGGLCAVSFIRTPIPVMGPPLPTSSPPKVTAPTPIPLVPCEFWCWGVRGWRGTHKYSGLPHAPGADACSLTPLGPTPALSSVRFPVSGHESCGRSFRQVAKAPRPDIAPPSSVPPLGGGAAAPGGSSLLCPAVPHRLVTVCTAWSPSAPPSTTSWSKLTAVSAQRNVCFPGRPCDSVSSGFLQMCWPRAQKKRTQAGDSDELTTSRH